MNAREIKSLGGIWGHQNGLLSVDELEWLMRLVAAEAEVFWPRRPLTVLEVGHYMGLSTCGIVHALRGVEGAIWTLDTVDAHIADDWVEATDPATFLDNMRAHFDDARLDFYFDISQDITAPLLFDFVFYDGDHGGEQARFTQAVIDSPRVRTFVFDDRDFPVPMRCCQMLREAGWRDESPPVLRAPGDKDGEGTMTLGVFRRMT